VAVINYLGGRGAWIGGTLLLASGLALIVVNLQAMGGMESLRAAWRGLADAPIETVKLVHGWLPRLVVCLIAGAALGAAGTVMQQVLRNPIASPMTLGVAAGAQLALSLVTLWIPGMIAALAEPAAMLGGVLALLLVLGLASRRGLDPVTVVLAGLVVSLYFGAVNAGLLLFFEMDLGALLIWGGGALAQHGWGDTLSLAPRVLLGIGVLALMIRPLTVMTLDEGSARGLGIGLRQTRLLALAVAVYLTAAVVASVGVIGFVGLAAPAIARLMGARTFAQRLMAAPMVGGVLLLFTDQLVQLAGGQMAGLLPTGAVTALLGAPLLLWLLRRVRTGAPVAAMARLQSPVAGHRKRLLLILVVAVTAVVLALCLGQDGTGWRLDSFVALFEQFPWRAPRVATALLAGILLATAGVILQRLLRNPMASPEVLGISGGALAGVVALVYLAPAAPYGALAGAGTLGALATVGGLIWFARRSGYAPERLLLAGVAIKALFDGLIGLVAASGVPFWTRLLNWVSGSTYGADWTEVLGGTLAVAALLPAALVLHRWLELLALGDVQARAQGVHVAGARLLLLALAAVGTAVATLLIGPLSFVGLMAPHLAYMLGLHRVTAQLLGACGIGAGLMVLADWAGRTLLVPGEVPAGIAASLIGGVYFMYLLRRL